MKALDYHGLTKVWDKIKAWFVAKSGDTMTGRLTMEKPINQVLIGTGTAATSSTSGSTTTYYPAKWNYDLGISTPTPGDRLVIKTPVAGSDWGEYLSTDNGTTYYPVARTTGATRLTNQYPAGAYICIVFEEYVSGSSAAGQVNDIFPIAGATARTSLKIGCWRVINDYDSGNTVSQLRTENGRFRTGSTGVNPYTLVCLDKNGMFSMLTSSGSGTGTSKTINTAGKFKLDAVILWYNGTATAANTLAASTYSTFSVYHAVDTRYSHNHTTTFTTNAPLYIECTIDADGFWSPTTTCITQTLTSGKYYIFLGLTYSTEYQLSLMAEHPLYYYDGTNLTEVPRLANADRTKLDGIAEGATKVESSSTNGKIKINGTDTTVYTHPTSGANTSKGDTTAQTPGFGDTFKVLSATVDSLGHATALADHTVTLPSTLAEPWTSTSPGKNGLMSASDKDKLDSITFGSTAVSAGTDIKIETSNGISTIAVNTSGAASGTEAFVEGTNTTASGAAAHAEGYRETPDKSVASAKASHIEGIDTLASGVASHAEGYSTIASSKHAHSEGEKTTASGESAHAEGLKSVAEGKHSHAEGESYASGENAHSEGYNPTASGVTRYGAQGIASHSEGSVTFAGGVSAHAEGGATNAIGKDSHSEGLCTQRPIRTTLSSAHTADTAAFVVPASIGTLDRSWYMVIPLYVSNQHHQFLSQVYAASVSGSNQYITTVDACPTALPSGTPVFFVSAAAAAGMASHTEGFDTLATGMYSHAEGQKTKAFGISSHAEGFGTVARDPYMHAAGKCNFTTTQSARVTGWGTPSNPKDIEVLDTDGNLYVAGRFKGATPLYIVPGITTYAAVDAAVAERRPLLLDISGLFPELIHALFVTTDCRKVAVDDLDHLEYHFKFDYPCNYRAGFYAGSSEGYVIYSYYIGVNESGWFKLVSVDGTFESRVWVAYTDTDNNLVPIPYVYAQSASNYAPTGGIATALAGKASLTDLNNYATKSEATAASRYGGQHASVLIRSSGNYNNEISGTIYDARGVVVDTFSSANTIPGIINKTSDIVELFIKVTNSSSSTANVSFNFVDVAEEKKIRIHVRNSSNQTFRIRLRKESAETTNCTFYTESSAEAGTYYLMNTPANATSEWTVMRFGVESNTVWCIKTL